jgi:hypothetical protein
VSSFRLYPANWSDLHVHCIWPGQSRNDFAVDGAFRLSKRPTRWHEPAHLNQVYKGRFKPPTRVRCAHRGITVRLCARRIRVVGRLVEGGDDVRLDRVPMPGNNPHSHQGAGPSYLVTTLVFAPCVRPGGVASPAISVARTGQTRHPLAADRHRPASARGRGRPHHAQRHRPLDRRGTPAWAARSLALGRRHRDDRRTRRRKVDPFKLLSGRARPHAGSTSTSITSTRGPGGHREDEPCVHILNGSDAYVLIFGARQQTEHTTAHRLPRFA